MEIIALTSIPDWWAHQHYPALHRSWWYRPVSSPREVNESLRKEGSEDMLVKVLLNSLDSVFFLSDRHRLSYTRPIGLLVMIGEVVAFKHSFAINTTVH